MKLNEIRNILEKDLRPKYERSRDSYISYTVNKMNINNEFLSKKQELLEKYGSLLNGRLSILFENSSKYLEELIPLCDTYFGKDEGKGRNGGLFGSVSNEVYKIVKDKKFTEEQIKNFYNDKFEKQLQKLLNSIIKDLEKFNLENLRIGNSEHDFNFIINESRSYTINTIIADGEIQCIHNRTLKKLHKGIV